jgi:hypothetical protein
MEKKGNTAEIADVTPGVAITIPQGVRFQFRNNGWETLYSFVLAVLFGPKVLRKRSTFKVNGVRLLEIECPNKYPT